MKLYDVMRKEEGKLLKERERESHEIPPPPPESHARFVITRRRLLVIAGSIIFMSILYGLGNQLVRAKITITERRIPFTLLGAALTVSNQESADSGRLSFQSMVVTTTITREVYGSALTTSNTKATGSVVFFNEYSTAKQTVKKGTTLTATNGKKYITQSQVVVPGYTVVDKKKVAGTSPSVDIAAVDTGESYNSTGTTLAVSGWANASKTFYARSATISGGDAGISHTLTDAEREQVIATLQSQLIERLKRETRAQIPADLATFPELQFPLIDTDSFSFKGGTVRFPASMTGTMVSYLIPRQALEQAIAAKALGDRTYPSVSIPDMGDLSIDLRSTVPTDPGVTPDAITIAVSGSGTVITKVPVDKVKERLLGVRRGLFTESLADIPEIESARFSFFPFWSPRFPSAWERINITTR